ncbi:MAG: DUF748 domain-containing protein [Desulfuromonadaceae bacterium]|nr:DUF748 domain-containing protein [Desulfuromonadaceae bacterium]
MTDDNNSACNMQSKPIPKKRLSLRLIRWGVGISIALVLVLYGASYFIDEPLRRITEKKINTNLTGYTGQLAGAHFQLIGLTLTFKGLTLFQQAHPDTPVIRFPKVTTTIHWREIFFGKLVAEVLLDQPALNINLLQLRNEVSSTIPLKDRGWQQAVEDIYPLKINSVIVNDATFTYIDQDPKKPLVLSHLNLQATNIRNIHQPNQIYPSAFHLDTTIFGTGHGSIDGDANFLGEPHPGIKARFKLENTPLDYFKSLISRSNLTIQGGVLQASGETEFAPTVKSAHLKNLTIQGMNMEYIHSNRTAGAEKKRVAVVKKTAKELSNKPGILIQADIIHLTGCTLGMVNNAARRPYRVFLSETDVRISNVSNQFSQGAAQVHLSAKFMGSGITTASATFRPEKSGPDFDLNLKIENTRMTSLNDVLRTYGNFDVSAGLFSLVSEIHVKNGRISGYIKPFFKDLNVYDSRKDKGKGVFHQMYEMMIGGAAQLLENHSHKEVATKAVISGAVGNPETSTWQIVGALLRNAFLQALLPNFEKIIPGSGKH